MAITTTHVKPGAKFNSAHLADHYCPGFDIAAIATDTVARFHELAAEAGDPSMRWYPETAEVHYECASDRMPIYEMSRDIKSIRDQAESETWARVLEGRYQLPEGQD